MAISRGLDVHELHLTTAHGRIWDQRPQVSREGVVLRVINSRRHAGDAQPVPFQAVTFSRDGQNVAAADKRGYLYILYLRRNSFSLLARGDGPVPGPNGICFTSQRHEEVLVATGNTVRAFDVDTHRNTALLQGHKREVRCVSSAGGSGVVLTQSSDLAILWDAKDWSRRRSMNAQEVLLHEAHFNPLGDLCAVLFRDSRVALWRTSTLDFERELIAPDGLLSPGMSREELGLKRFAMNDRRLIAGGSGGLLLAWSLTAPTRPPLAIELQGAVLQLQLGILGPHGEAPASAGASTVVFVLLDDGRLMIVQLKGLQVLVTLDLHQAQRSTAIAFNISCDSKSLALARSDGTMEVRDLQATVASELRELQRRVQIGAPPELLRPQLRRIRYPTRGASVGLPVEEAEDEDDDEDAISMPHLGIDSTGNGLVAAESRPSRRSQRNNGQPIQGARKLGKVSDLHQAVRSAASCPYCNTVYMFDALYCRHCGKKREVLEDESPGLQNVTENDAEASPSMQSRRHEDLEEELPTGETLQDILDEDTVAGVGSLFARKLQTQLRSKGGAFPEAQRARLWRRLLQLPCNLAAYEDLEEQGTHPRFRDLRTQYPAHTRSTLMKLERLLSAVAHWSRTWSEAAYLPALAFPFVKVFGDEPTLCFEAVVSVLMTWARGWHDELPGPPLSELIRLDDLLASADPALHSHLRLVCQTPHTRSGGAVHLKVLWPLLQSLLTEVLPKKHWLQLWDHLVAHWLEPELLHAAVVAFLKASRESLLDLPLQSPGDLAGWLHLQQKVDMPSLLENMYALRLEAAAIAPSALSPDDLAAGVLGVSTLGAAGLPSAPMPLPRGRHYPKVDPDTWPHGLGAAGEQAAATKARAAAQLSSQREEMVELSTAVERLANEEARFRQQQEELLNAEHERRKIAQEEEDRLLAERRQMDEALMQKRLQQVRQVYEGMERQLEQQKEARAAESHQMLEDLQRRHKQRAYELEARLKEEAVLNLEAQGAKCISELLRKRREEESLRHLQGEVRYRRKAMELQDEVQRQQWMIDDERERARLEAMRDQKLQQDQKDEELRRRRQVEMELRLEELERQLKLAQVARERVLRRARTDAAQAQEASEELQMRRHEVAARSERRQRDLALAQERRRQRDQLRQRERLVDEETKRWREALERQSAELGEQSIDELRKDYEARQMKVQEEALHRDIEDEELLRKTLQEVERTCNQPAEASSPKSPARAQAVDSLTCPQCGTVYTADAVFCRRCGQKRGPADEVPEAILSSSADDAEKAEQLDVLIKQREAELEALWREFDAEARDLSEEEAATALSSEHFSTAKSGALGGTEGALRGPLGGTWGDTSEESAAAGGRYRGPVPATGAFTGTLSSNVTGRQLTVTSESDDG